MKSVSVHQNRVSARRPLATKAQTAAATSVSTSAPVSTLETLAVLKKACKDTSVPTKEVFQAMRALQRQKLPATGWDKVIGSNKVWRLVYQADAANVQKSLKDPQAGTGKFFPVTACQRFDLSAPPEGRLRNGVYLPHLANLIFQGAFSMAPDQTKLEFNIDKISIKLGPLQFGPFKIDIPVKKSLPFFLFFYADEDIICAQGKSGGIAMWAKADGSWLLERGIA